MFDQNQCSEKQQQCVDLTKRLFFYTRVFLYNLLSVVQGTPDREWVQRVPHHEAIQKIHNTFVCIVSTQYFLYKHCHANSFAT